MPETIAEARAALEKTLLECVLPCLDSGDDREPALRPLQHFWGLWKLATSPATPDFAAEVLFAHFRQLYVAFEQARMNRRSELRQPATGSGAPKRPRLLKIHASDVTISKLPISTVRFFQPILPFIAFMRFNGLNPAGWPPGTGYFPYARAAEYAFVLACTRPSKELLACLYDLARPVLARLLGRRRSSVLLDDLVHDVMVGWLSRRGPVLGYEGRAAVGPNGATIPIATTPAQAASRVRRYIEGAFRLRARDHLTRLAGQHQPPATRKGAGNLSLDGGMLTEKPLRDIPASTARRWKASYARRGESLPNDPAIIRSKCADNQRHVPSERFSASSAAAALKRARSTVLSTLKRLEATGQAFELGEYGEYWLTRKDLLMLRVSLPKARARRDRTRDAEGPIHGPPRTDHVPSSPASEAAQHAPAPTKRRGFPFEVAPRKERDSTPRETASGTRRSDRV